MAVETGALRQIRLAGIECPKHNGRFDIRTGAVLRPPPRVALKTYEVHARDGKVLLKVG